MFPPQSNERQCRKAMQKDSEKKEKKKTCKNKGLSTFHYNLNAHLSYFHKLVENPLPSSWNPRFRLLSSILDSQRNRLGLKFTIKRFEVSAAFQRKRFE